MRLCRFEAGFDYGVIITVAGDGSAAAAWGRRRRWSSLQKLQRVVADSSAARSLDVEPPMSV
jgi:hypothetical protein